MGARIYIRPWQCLYFLPEPHGQSSLRPTLPHVVGSFGLRSVTPDAGGAIATTFDERDDAVKAMLSMAIAACRKAGKYAGICGQGPSDHPDLAQWLVEQKIESISLNPDTVVETWLALAKSAGAK